MTNVPSPTFGPTGFVAPAAADVLAGVQADISAAFGVALNYSLTTPQGQLAGSEAAIIVNVNSIFIYYTNQVDPAYATGRMQDAIARIYFLERIPSAPTVLQVSCSGLAGVVIPIAALISDDAGNIYMASEEATIPVGGLVTVQFEAKIPGPTLVPSTDAVSIYQAIPGWDSVTCLSGVEGSDVESRQAFEARRAASVAINSVGSVPAIRGAVLAVPGVLDAYVTENATSGPVTIGGFTLAAHSLYVAAVGGTSADVARAIWSKKAPGCNYNGNTTVTVVDDNSGYAPPLPSYAVTFERPAALPILFKVNLANSPLLPANAVTLIQNAIVAAFAGADGGLRASIGSTIYASRFVVPVAALGAWVQMRSMFVGSNNNAGAVAFTASVAGTTMTVTAVASGTLVPGQTISDITGNLVVGTTIISQSSGTTGSTGTYVVSNSQTVASEAMQGAVADQDFVIVRIDQVPTIDPNDIQVTVT